MNDTKWREVFAILIEQRVHACTWHFLNDSGEYRWPLPLLSDIRQDHVADGSWCPMYFRDIEQVHIPMVYEVSRGPGLEPWRRENDLEALKRALRSLGQLDLDEEPDGLTIHGHRPSDEPLERTR